MLNFKYDVTVKSRHPRTKYDQEKNLVHEFNASQHKNVCLEYASVHDAKNAAQAIVSYIKQTRTPVIVAQREKCLILLRKEGA